MTSAEFCQRIDRQGFTQRGFAVYVGANERTVRRWALGEQDIPEWVGLVLNLMEAPLTIGNLRIRLGDNPDEIVIDRDGEGGHFSLREFTETVHKFISERL